MWADTDYGEAESRDNHEVPTFDDLAINDELSDVERVTTYATSHIELQRYVHIKMLGETAQQAGYETAKEKFFPILATVAQDNEYLVRQQLALELEQLCRLCHDQNSDEAYNTMLKELIPMLDQLLHDQMIEVRTSAAEVLVAVSHFVRDDDIMEHILSIMLNMAHDQEYDEIRMTAASLLNDLAERFGVELCHQFVIPEVISLSEDPVFRVRKAVALNIDKVFKMAGQGDSTQDAVEERVLPAFIRLTTDPIWGVRKACAESFASISKEVDVSIRINHLMRIQDMLSNDASKWVRASMLQKLGRFIATLPAEHVTDEILSRYIGMVKPDTRKDDQNAKGHQEIPQGSQGAFNPHTQIHTNDYHCAFTLPAVVQTLGPKRWERLFPLFKLLVRNEQRAVRRVMSHSLHELGRLLGEEIAERDLCSPFHLFLGDLDDVKMGVVKNMAAFLGVLSPSTREKYLNVIKETCDTSTYSNWRFRLLIANQLKDFTRLFSSCSTFNVIAPLCFDLINDEVHVVGDSACGAMGALLKRLGETEKMRQEQICCQIVEFQKGESYFVRQQYIKICNALLDSADVDVNIFVDKFLEPLLELAKDEVSNVRLLLAKSLKGHFDKLPLEQLRTTLEELRVDRVADIVNIITSAEGQSS
mmetsp:Transcript_6604/g.8048  ORF Transcript_6604/g.8048 Transcript_6604/m.8048 type:complete len:646 (+) Transcript_6604:314-2251(+)|eukprot:CAMPEP_0204834252 /NCGR_PEP_ID=MMETSP1346-20131115/19284_1 /ASSEMBLY_ACC=CAM_ASM_000771 /TAXON_ID=215587 /ORGANISM="Aplanochytrium stocchinoi, Strain GSBS06" /LENGTH=645 /DNA_ID=CAMNT_0051967437 /DNA_START=262 /DNA_END=2199 /DNA_ORIENTATION=-